MFDKQPTMESQFPRYLDHRSVAERRDYVAGRMIEMIADGTFYLTEIMNQDDAVKQSCADAIFGRWFSDGSDGHTAGQFTTGNFIAPEIAAHEIRIVAVDGKTSVRYVDGSRPAKGIIVGNQTRRRIPINVANTIDLGKADVMVHVREAWLILKEHGAWVAFADLPQDRAMLWLYREVRANETAAARKTG